jgi:hypothetical protein
MPETMVRWRIAGEDVVRASVSREQAEEFCRALSEGFGLDLRPEFIG